MSARREPLFEKPTGTPAAPAGASAPLGGGQVGDIDADVAAEIDAIGIDHDALLNSMVFLTRHHGKERSPDSLMDGMPIDGLLGPDQAVRVMRAAGYNSGLMQRRISEIHALLLPAILLLKNGDACVLVKRFDSPPGVSPMCEVVMPGPEFHVCRATESE